MADDGGHDPRPPGGPGSADPETVVRAYWHRVWLERDLAAFDDLVAGVVVRHGIEGTETLTREQLRQRLADAHETVRASEVSVDAATADGATVWIRVTLRGVSLATSAPLAVAWLAQYRVEDGRIAEIWSLHQAGLDWGA